MSGEETECRLTYKEGRDIKTEAMRPYMKIAGTMFLMAALVMGVVIVGGAIETLIGMGHPQVDRLLADGDITQALHDYIVQDIDRGRATLGMVLALTVMVGGFVICMIGEIEATKALKKANEEEKKSE